MGELISQVKDFLLEQLSANQFLQGGVILSLLASILYSLKGVPKMLWQRIRRKIIFRVNIEEKDQELYNYFERWLIDHYERSYRNVVATIKYEEGTTENETVEPLKEISNGSDSNKNNQKENLYLKQYTDSFLINYKGTFLRVYKGREKFENANSFYQAFFNNYSIEGLWCKNKIKKLMQEVIEYNQQFKKTSINIYTNTDFGEWQRINNIAIKDIDKIVIDNKYELLTDIDNFLSNKRWYTDRAIPYKRGYLFYGKPGNGKTSLCLSLAKKYNRNIYFLNLNGMTDKDVKRAFRDIGNNSILVIEDIDAIFSNRKSKKTKSSFSNLLNCLDGVFYKEGCINILTTNHPEKLDPALIRKGRVDMRINVTNPTRARAEEYLNIFYEKDVKLASFKDGSKSMVDIQNACMNYKDEPELAVKEILNGTTVEPVHQNGQLNGVHS